MNFDRIPLSRRNLLKYSAVGAIAGGTLSTTACSSNKPQEVGIVNAEGKRVLPWSNWSGNQHCQPADRIVPRNEDELLNLVRTGKQQIRMLGSGHSFSGLVPTDQTLISLARLRGIENVDKTTNQVDVLGGTRLSQLGKELWDNDLSVINMSDIDSQTFAGAVATATHGTGRELNTISSHMQSSRFITANGDIIDCSPTENKDLYQASGCNLGALGDRKSVV